MLDHVPLGRPDVDEIAVAALFLADPENSYMNGHIVTVDGGWTAGYAVISDGPERVAFPSGKAKISSFQETYRCDSHSV